MLVRITDNRFLYFEQLTPSLTERLVEWFSVRDPNFCYKRGFIGGMHYDGRIIRFNSKHRRLALPFLGELRRKCAEYNIPLQIMDERLPEAVDPSVVDENWLPGITLDPYQVRAIKAAATNDHGIVCLPTGSGKGEIIAGITKLFNCQTTVLANQTVVIQQLKDRLELRDVVDEVGMFYAGTTPRNKLVCVGTIQSLIVPPAPTPVGREADEYLNLMSAHQTRRKNAGKYREFLKHSDMVIVDECDQATSTNYRRLFRMWYDGRRRYGMSATPFDKHKPIDNLYVREHFGSIITQTKRSEVEAAGRIIPVRYVMLAIGEDGYRWEKSAWDIAIREKVVENEKFHEKVARIVSAFPDEGTLILVEFSDLGRALEQKIPGSVFVYGETPQRRRREAFRSFERRECKCLIGGKIIKRGFDLRGGCENLVLCGMGQMHSDVIQQVGRAMRVNTKGFARVFDFYCMDNIYLYEHSRERLKAMVKEGYNTTVVFKNGRIDGAELVRRKFKIPFKIA